MARRAVRGQPRTRHPARGGGAAHRVGGDRRRARRRVARAQSAARPRHRSTTATFGPAERSVTLKLAEDSGALAIVPWMSSSRSSSTSASGYFTRPRTPAGRSAKSPRHASCVSRSGPRGKRRLLSRAPARPLQGRLHRQGAARPARGARADGPCVLETQGVAVSGSRGIARAQRLRRRGTARSRSLEVSRHRAQRGGARRARRSEPPRRSSILSSIRCWRVISPSIRSSIGTTSRRNPAPIPSISADVSCVSDDVRYWIATAPIGAASVLAEELQQFGASDIRERSHDVKFQGALEVGYRACLWSRTATRVLLSVGSIEAKNLSRAVRGREANRLAPPSCARRDARLRVQRRERRHSPHPLWLAAPQRCRVRRAARIDGRASGHRARASRRAAAFARRGHHRPRIGGFLG